MLSGSLVALVTPMDEHGDLDFVSLRQLVEYHIAAGTAGIVAMGTTGESATLDLKEHLQVVSKTLEYAQGRIPVIAGCGSNSTRHAIELARQVKALGIECGLSVTPYYNSPPKKVSIATTHPWGRLVVCRKSFIMCRDAPAAI